MTTNVELERQALKASLTGLTGRTRAFLFDVEAYQAEIRRAAHLPHGADDVLTVLAELLNGEGQPGSVRRLEAAASAALRRMNGDETGRGGRSMAPGGDGSTRRTRSW